MKFPRSQMNRKRVLVLIGAVLMLATFAVVIFVQARSATAPPAPEVKTKKEEKPPVEPTLETSEVLSGLSHPWDVVFLPDNTLVFNERGGQVSKLVNGEKIQIADISDVYTVGEGGLTGLTLDADFKTNRYVYTCFNSRGTSGIDVRLVRWRLNEPADVLSDRQDIVIGIPSNTSGRHSGCRVRAASDGTLWVGTGDAAIASYPQNPKSLGGKILHVTRDGMPASDNLPEPFDPRIFSYGHRNVQGLALFDKSDGGVYGYSVEHGSDRDDEVNLLKSGNFGWAPRVTYVERGIPMTDTERFPGAVSAVWSSGFPTIAPSGVTLIKGEQWGAWDGALAVAVLKDKHVHIFKFDDAYGLSFEREVLSDFGRVRSVTQGPDGNLYLSTDNGSNDMIIKVIPKGNE